MLDLTQGRLNARTMPLVGVALRQDGRGCPCPFGVPKGAGGAAEKLGVKRSILQDKMKKFGQLEPR
jgi:hypothetical protein